MTSGVLVPIEDVAKFFSVSVSTIRVWVEAMEKEFNPAKANKSDDVPKPQPQEMITFEDM